MPLSEDSTNSPSALRDWIKRKLLAWFAQNQRELPWREDRDPYRILISEVMLQQTQVVTVVPYFHRFLEAFPDIQSLAQAEEQEVLRFWSGLGYYRRARFLHQAAKEIVDKHEGKFPQEPKVLQQLPGMGRYTVNAVLSQAFDHRLPILEANSQRVLCRLFGRREDPTVEPLRSWLWTTAEEILPLRKHSGDFNQALMELGALICKPNAPQCSVCPLRMKCETKKNGLQEVIPFRATPSETIAVDEVALVIWKKDKVLFCQRHEKADRWAGMWECPHVPLKESETHLIAAKRLLKSLDLRVSLGEELTTIRHGVTKYAITMKCLRGEYQSGRVKSDLYSQHRWLRPAEIDEYPVSSPQRRLLAHLLE